MIQKLSDAQGAWTGSLSPTVQLDMCMSASSERVETGLLGFASNHSELCWRETSLGAARGINNAATNRQASVLTIPRLSEHGNFSDMNHMICCCMRA